MHSLSELNGYSNTPIEYNDERPQSGYGVTNHGTQTITVNQGGSFNLPNGLTDLTGTSIAKGDYRVNLNPFYTAGYPAHVDWETPAGVNISISGNIQIAANVDTNAKLTTINSSSLSLGTDYYLANTISYTTALISSESTESFNTTVNINKLWTPNVSYNYVEDTAFPITNVIENPLDPGTISDITYYYTLEYEQISPSNTFGRFIENNVTFFPYDGKWSYTNNKYMMHTKSLKFEPPPNYTDTIVINAKFTQYLWAGNIAASTVISNLTMPFTITNIGSTPEYSAPSTLSGSVNTLVSLSGYQVLDPYAPDKAYTMTLTIADDTKGFFRAGATGYGNTATVSGTASSINGFMHDLKIETISTGSTTVTMVLDQTAPTNLSLGSQVTTLTVNPPPIGTAWKGGLYAGPYNITTGLTTAPTHYLIVENTFSNRAFIKAYSSLSDNEVGRPAPSDNSLLDGAANTLAFQNQTAPLGANYPSINDALSDVKNYAGGGYTDWYIPSVQELIAAKNIWFLGWFDFYGSIDYRGYDFMSSSYGVAPELAGAGLKEVEFFKQFIWPDTTFTSTTTQVVRQFWSDVGYTNTPYIPNGKMYLLKMRKEPI